MRFGDWLKLLLIIGVCCVLGFIVMAFAATGELSDSGRVIGLVIGLIIMFGGPWMGFRSLRSGSTCEACGKKWSLYQNGYEDGPITELHERGSDGEIKLIHKWTRRYQYKCKACGDETVTQMSMKEMV